MGTTSPTPEMGCNFSDNIWHGEYKEYYGEVFSKQLMHSGSYNKGKKHGEWRMWDYSPTDDKGGGHFYLMLISNYHNGELRDQKTYNRDGELIQDMRYNGRSFDCTEHNYARAEGTRKNGQWDGQLKITYKDGSWEIATVKDGAREGLTTEYYPSGQKASETSYTYTSKGPNKIIGTVRSWHENGQLKGVLEYSTDGNETLLSEKTYDDKGRLLGELTLDQAKNIVHTTIYDTETGVKSYTLEQKPKSTPKQYIRRVEFYPNGTIKAELFQEPSNGILKKTYHEDGKLASTKHKDGSISEYHANGKLKRKILWLDANTRTYQAYDENGNMKFDGILDKDHNELETNFYTNGLITGHYNYKTNILTTFDASGFVSGVTDVNNITGYYNADGNIVGKSRDSEQTTPRGLRMEDYVGFYPNGQVKEKGVRYKEKRVGLWYEYSSNGKLSIWEDGATRKPTKEERANHNQYLQDLINAKVPAIPVKTKAQSRAAEEDFLRGR